jgi:hypothetical protein
MVKYDPNVYKGRPYGRELTWMAGILQWLSLHASVDEVSKQDATPLWYCWKK